MKKIITILIIIVAIAGVLAYTDKDFRHWLMDRTGQAPSSSKVYKWQDANGHWQISNTPPPPGTPYTEQEYLHDANVVPAVPTAQE